jgi:enoyl-CoA hydratase/carnithine racemase
MMMPDLAQRDGLHVLDLGDDENRFSPAWLDAVDDALDHVVASPAPLVTVGSGKFYSNGLDLDWLSANPAELTSYTARIEALLARVLTLPVPTIAAVNGHAFGGGAMFAIASMTTGRRFGGPDAVLGGLVDATASEADLLEVATSMVAGLSGKNPQTLGTIKTTMYAEAVRALTEADS